MITRSIALFLLFSISMVMPSWSEETVSTTSKKQDIEEDGIDASIKNSGDAIRVNDINRRLEAAEKLIKVRPEMWLGYWSRARIKGEEYKDYASAVVDLEQVNRLEPNHKMAWGYRCWYLLLLGRFEESRIPCEKDEALNPAKVTSMVNLGHAYLLQGDSESAMQWYRKSLPFFRDDKELNSGPLSDFDLFISRGWSVQDVKKTRSWLERTWADWKEVSSLHHLVIEDNQAGNDKDAIPKAEAALRLTRAVLGEEHLKVAVSLKYLAISLQNAEHYSDAEPLYREALAIQRKALPEGSPEIAITLDDLGVVLQALGRYDEAELLLREALAIRRKALPVNNLGVAQILNDLAYLLNETGRENEAEPLYRESLAIRRKSLPEGNLKIANSLLNLAGLLVNAGSYAESESLFQEALGIYRKSVPQHNYAVVNTLCGLSDLLRIIGRYKEAEQYVREAITILREANLHDSLFMAASLNNLALVLLNTGRYAEAESLYRESILIYERGLVTNHLYALSNKKNLANLLELTGRYDEAESLYREILGILNDKYPLNHFHISTTLNDLATVLFLAERYSETLPLYRESLEIDRQYLPANHKDIAVTLTNIGRSLTVTGEFDEAEKLYREALVMLRKVLPGGHRAIANALSNLAELLAITGRDREAEPLFAEALFIADQAGDPWALYRVQYNISISNAKQLRPELAIFYGKQAVNTLQSMRRNLQTSDREIQQTFVKSKEGYYKHLADLLVGQGRLPEAEQVLAMLKEQEYYDFIRGDATRGDVRQTRVDCNVAEAPWCERSGEISDRLAGLGSEYATLKEKEKGGLDTDEQARVTQLESDLKVARQAFNSFLDELKQGLVKTERTLPPEVGKRHRQLQAALRTLGHGAVALHYFVTDERLNIILTTPDTQLARQLPWDETALKDSLNQSVLDLRARLTHPGKDPRPLAKELYDTLIGPIAADLEQVKAQTLMVSLDGALRYLPLAALYDGEHYLAEHYALVIYTEAANLSLTSDPQPWRVAGLGVSRSKHGDLDTVPQELEAIVRHGDQDGDGVLPGMIELDGAFTEAALQEASQVNAGYPVLHVASHFVFNPGNVANSYLVLGNDEALTLARIREEDLDLGGVELLTLSACETAMGGSGSEVEGFGALAQDQGAQGVMASLWKVADKSTGTFMAEFYRRREAEHLTKAEALRRVQLAFIRGEISPQGQGTGARRDVGCLLNCDRNGENAANAPSATADYSHPYYWAPFILMGNWL